jgi:PEP-CTERM motif-containing protein
MDKEAFWFSLFGLRATRRGKERGKEMKKKLAKGICLMAFGLGLLLLSTAPALADQITVCQSCTAAPTGDPNIILDTSSFNMLLQGSGSNVSPTYIVIAEYNGGGSTPGVTVNGSAINLATADGSCCFGLTTNTANFTSGGVDVFATLGLASGNSLSFSNLNTHLTGIAAPASSFTLYAFQYDHGLVGVANGTSNILNLGLTGADIGSYIFGYGCGVATEGNAQCSPQGQVSQTVMTNAGAVPEPSSLLLLGAGLVGIGIWSWRRKALKV